MTASPTPSPLTLVDRAVVIAGGHPSVVDALGAALTVAGATVLPYGVHDQRQHRPDALVLNPGASWRAHPGDWNTCLDTTHEAAAQSSRRPGPQGHLIVCGPPLVAVPGPGYREYVKARLALGQLLRDIAEADGAPTAVALWPAGVLTDHDGLLVETRVRTLCGAVLALLAPPSIMGGQHVVDADVVRRADATHARIGAPALRSAGGRDRP